MLLTACLALLAAACLAPVFPAPDPHALIDSATNAMQRSAVLRDMKVVRLTGIQHEFMFGNAERAEGPWRVFYSQFTELRDETGPSFRRSERGIAPSGTMSTERVSVLADSVLAMRAGGREAGSSRASYEDAIDRIDGSPERALRLAAASNALTRRGTVSRYGLTFDVVAFPWRNGRMQIEINRETHLPDAVEIVRTYPDNFRWAPFGVVTMRAEYVDWTVQPWGGYWPMQEKISLNGQPLRDITFAGVEANPSAVADSFTISDSARTQFAANSKLSFSTFAFGARGQPTEFIPGIVRVPDQWAMTLVKQPDGVVVFEAHISGSYLRSVIDEANRRWPGAPIKALALTSDPWAHLGGFSEAVALGIPIYVNARSIPFLTSLAKTTHPVFRPVHGKTVIGTGDNRIELYPVGGPYAERMTMAYFPQHKLLYGADLVFRNRGPDGQPTSGFVETAATDLRRAVTREHLAVDTLLCVQNYGPVNWEDFSGAP